MAGAMDMAGKLPKIRDEERENRVSEATFETFEKKLNFHWILVWICVCCLWTCGDRRTHVWQCDVRARQVKINISFG